MINLLHFADTHLGMENYGSMNTTTGLSTRVHDFAKRLDEMLDYARQHYPDLAIFAGDAFKNRQPNPTLQREFADRVRELSKLCPVVLLVGNHDLPSNTERASSIEIYETLDVPKVTVGREYVVHDIETVKGIVQVGTAPYPTRSQLLQEKETLGLNMQGVEALFLRKLLGKLQGMAELVKESPRPRILAGHFSVAEATTGSERGLMLGKDFAVPLSELAIPAWDYVALGHIHKHQNLTHQRKNAPPVVYSGSIECIDFGEAREQKGFVWAQVERGSSLWQFIPVNHRRFLTLEIDIQGLAGDIMSEILEDIDTRGADLPDAVVKIILNADEDQDGLIRDRDIIAHLMKYKVSHVAGIERQINRTLRSRLGKNPESLDNLQLLEQYFIAKGTPAEYRERLLEMGQSLMAD
jgi:exonuclease SbcD